MSGDVRSLIQAAQAAEGRGEPLEAASLLRRAAGLCEDGGRPARAAQLLRHAVRLSPEPAAIAWLDSLERRGAAEVPPQGTASKQAYALEDAEAQDGALRDPVFLAAGAGDRDDPDRAHDAAAGPGAARRASSTTFGPRGPMLADAAAEAWCSFCCRPSAEAGALAEGANGAFVCSSCLRQAARLLGGGPGQPPSSPLRTSTPVGLGPAATLRSHGDTARRITGSLPWEHARAPTPAEAPIPRVWTPPGEHPRTTPPGTSPAVDPPDELLLAHHLETLVEIERALAEDSRAVLLLGPHGSGRSTCLRTLVPRLGAEELSWPFDLEPRSDVWLLDDAQLLSAVEWSGIERLLERRPDARLVVTAPLASAPRTAALRVRTAQLGRFDVWSTAQLSEAAPGLPEGLAARVSRVVQVGHPDEAQLSALATSQLTRLRPGVEDAAGLGAQLAKLAVASGRGLHELLVLIQRLPVDVLGAVVAPPRAKAAGAKSRSAKKSKPARGPAKGRPSR